MDENLPPRINYWLSDAKHDCFFVVGPEDEPTERIGAIKHLLMGDSEPFRAMLQDSELAEKTEIRLKDVDPETFKNFLKCVYGGSDVVIPKLSFEECANLLYIADKYLVNDLKNELTKHLISLFSPDKFYFAISHPICYEETSLKEEIHNCLKLDFNKITMDENFLELSDNTIKRILQQEIIYAKEGEIWNAILRWAKHKTGSSNGEILRLFVLDFFKYFRFLTMDYAEFLEDVVSTEILLDEEVSDICRAFVSGKPGINEYMCYSRNNRYNTGMVSNHISSSFMENPKFAFIRCLVNSVSDLPSYTQFSETYYWAGNLWNLLVRKDGNEENYSLSLGVYCNGKTKYWNCAVSVEVRLCNQAGKPCVIHNLTQMFSHSKKFCGWKSFIKWDTLINPDNGFIKDNSIILMAKIQLVDNIVP